MRRLHRPSLLLVVLTLGALSQVATRCSEPPSGEIEITSPAGANVAECIDSVVFVVEGVIQPGSLAVTLNGEPIDAERADSHLPWWSRWRRSGEYHAPVIGLLESDNLVEIRALRIDESEIVASHAFHFEPPVRAERIADESELIRGPLAHGRVGDWMLRNCTARFIIQDGAQRDLYSVGGYGGNLIDMELLSNPGLDNFIEIQPTLDAETVVNAQIVEIVNDGVNGDAASIRSCGPDDLLDFINPSSQISGIPGLSIPGHADDLDLPIEACTTYALEPFVSRVRMDTAVTNNAPIQIPLLVGDWINAGGELENLFAPGAGPGSGLTADLGSISWFGYGEASGVDYSYTTIPLPDYTGPLKGSYLNTSGVTLVLHNVGVLSAITGTHSPFWVFPGETRTFTRYFGVGDGSASNAVDMAADVRGLATGRVEGCVTIAGSPAAGARVAVGTHDDGEIGDFHTLFTTDDDGCYAGEVIPTPAGDQYAMAAARTGHLYEGGGLDPLLHLFTVGAGETVTLPNVDLPAPGRVFVTVREHWHPTPARVTVVGFDPSPEPIIPGASLFGLNIGDIGLFRDPTDARPFGVVAAHYTDAAGRVSFDLEPGTYEIYVSRGTEYSLFHQRRSVGAGETVHVFGQIKRVVETPGFISSDFHVHGIHSADSRVSHTDRVMQFAGEGVDNVVMTDHHVHTDLKPRIAELGMQHFVTGTIGEEITSFDYGHWNGYPFTIDPTKPSGGSTDWAQAAPPGMDFPQYGNLNATPAEVYDLATTGPQSLPSTVVQVNHIGSHFSPLKIDTAATPIQDGLDDDERTALRLPTSGNLFHPFDALELWNGDSRGSQRSFLEDRIGIWFNHLNQGLPITFIADTDTHQFFNLNAAGARTWTPSSSDAPQAIDSNEVGEAIGTGRAVGGQGIYVQTRLFARDGSGNVADFSLDGETEVASSDGNLDLEIHVQSPAWAEYDSIEIYANAATVVQNPAEPYEYGAIPSQVLAAGVDFDVDLVEVDSNIPGAQRFETHVSVPFDGLTEDTWFVVVVKGSDGVSRPMFPVFAENIPEASNSTLDDLTDGNLGESGVMALGATNALYADVDGEPGFQIGP